MSLRDNQTISRQKALALSLRRDNDHIAATAKMAVLIVAAFPSRLSRYNYAHVLKDLADVHFSAAQLITVR